MKIMTCCFCIAKTVSAWKEQKMLVLNLAEQAYFSSENLLEHGSKIWGKRYLQVQKILLLHREKGLEAGSNAYEKDSFRMERIFDSASVNSKITLKFSQACKHCRKMSP